MPRVGPDRMQPPFSRSEQMARIRARNTSPERELRRILWARGLRYRLHVRTPGGRPDVVFPGARVAVFIDGCFWHGCPKHYVRPRTRGGFWSLKLKSNFERDRVQTALLERAGWRVIRIWEHEIAESLAWVATRIEAAVREAGPGRLPTWRVVDVAEIEGSPRRELRTMKDIRNPDRMRAVVQVRSTRKWKRRSR